MSNQYEEHDDPLWKVRPTAGPKKGTLVLFFFLLYMRKLELSQICFLTKVNLKLQTEHDLFVIIPSNSAGTAGKAPAKLSPNYPQNPWSSVKMVQLGAITSLWCLRMSAAEFKQTLVW